MCGIVGIVASNGTVDPPNLQRMSDLLVHRGPDGEGFLFASGCWDRLRYSVQRRAERGLDNSLIRVGLGHRRLAILDLSDRGLQPMCMPDGKTWIVFNGEVYNHAEIRSLLKSEGHEFTTTTDTEVLLHAYVRWGERCIDRLDGMFAFAVWDDANRRLFCGRDRLGIKPFYYATPNGNFTFASEIKALLADPQCQREADDKAVVGFLVHGNCDYAERTLFRGIQSLPAAHTLTVDAATGGMSIRRYWQLDARSQGKQTDDAHIAQVREALVASVRTHLISDVRAGSCLSGGLDSSSLVATIGKIWRDEPEAAAAIGERLYTFTSCYEQQRAFDEREYALEVARSVGAKPHLVFPSPDDFWSNFQRIAWHQDMPFGALSFYAQWCVMRAAKEGGVKVLIDGQGGDEVFGGYAKFRYAYLASLLRGGRIGVAIRELTGLLRQGDRYVLDIRKGYRYLPAYVRRALNVDSALQQILTENWNDAIAEDSTPANRWWRNARNGNGAGSTMMQRIQVDDIVVDTLPQLLRMEDRSSMAFSLEARVPMLDHHVVQLGVSLPDHMKVNRGWSKFAVRQAMSGLVPDAVRLRKTKLGFAAPDRAWLADDLRAPINELLENDLRCQRFVNVPALRRWYRGSDARVNTESFLGLFRVLSLEMWMRAFAL